MSFYGSVAGGLLLLLSAYLLWKGYDSYLKKRSGEYEDLVRLLEHMAQQLECRLSEGAAMLSGFCSDRLSELGFFQGEGGVGERFHRIAKRLTVNTKTRERLERFFSEFGTGYLGTERERIDRELRGLREERDRVVSECEKDTHLCRALLLLGALGLIIFLI